MLSSVIGITAGVPELLIFLSSFRSSLMMSIGALYDAERQVHGDHGVFKGYLYFCPLFSPVHLDDVSFEAFERAVGYDDALVLIKVYTGCSGFFSEVHEVMKHSEIVIGKRSDFLVAFEEAVEVGRRADGITRCGVKIAVAFYEYVAGEQRLEFGFLNALPFYAEFAAQEHEALNAS